MKILFACLLPALLAASAGENARVVYSKYFKGSVPEYVNITVGKSGKVVYKESVNDELPIEFNLPEPQIAEIFDLAEKLGRFSQPLESPAKVANMGMKTFRYEDPAANSAKSEVKFNYTEVPDAKLLADWFDRIIETEQDYIGLERAVKFDKLGVNQALLQVQGTLERKRLVGPLQFLPLLDRIVKNDSYMHMSRERAASLAETFRKSP